MIPLYQTFTIPANGGSYILPLAGAVLTVKSATLPVLVAVDGRNNQPVQCGSVIHGPFNALGFTNLNTVAVTLAVWIGDQAVPFSPADNSASNSQTYVVGNFGIASGTSGSYAGQTVAVTAAGYVTVPTAPAITLTGSDSGHRRQVLLLSIAPSTVSANSLAVQDANGCTLMIIPAGSPPVALATDAAVQLVGVGGTAYASIGQFYLSATQ